MSSADIEAHGHIGGCPGCAALGPHGRATKPTTKNVEKNQNDKPENFDGTDTGRVNERKSARAERGAEDVLMESGNEEQMADRHAVASGSLHAS